MINNLVGNCEGEACKAVLNALKKNTALKHLDCNLILHGTEMSLSFI